MEPRIQYAKTEDGVSIAYWKMGRGSPVIPVIGVFSHLQKEWVERSPRRERNYRTCRQVLSRHEHLVVLGFRCVLPGP